MNNEQLNSNMDKNMEDIPAFLGEKYGSRTKSLNLSYNCLSALTNMENFINLEELVLDNNLIGNFKSFSRYFN